MLRIQGGEERYAPCPHGMYCLVHSCLYLLIKSQKNVHRRQFPLYNPSLPPTSTPPTPSIPYLRRENTSTGSRHLSEIPIWNSFSAALLGSSFASTPSLFQKWPGKEKNRQSYTAQMTHLARQGETPVAIFFVSILILLGKAREAQTAEVATLKLVSNKS